jgi:short-subunit dehydrogenase
MDTARLMKLNFMALSAAEVARAGVEGLEAGRAIVIPGLVNRFGAWGAQHLAPRFLTRKLAGKLQA